VVLKSHDGHWSTISHVSTPYLQAGRQNQKLRTREALVMAARELVADGGTPTVEAAAERAAISRTTAYRYFANQRELLLAAHPETGTTSLLPTPPPVGAPARLDAVVTAFTSLVLETEAQQRTMLRLSLEMTAEERASLPLRQGRGIGWIGEALEPLRGQLTDDELHGLTLAIRTVTGIEAMAWLTDVAGLPRQEAVALMQWSAQALLHAATTDLPFPAATAKRARRRP
jgi:AcrR family transcriptional regulator